MSSEESTDDEYVLSSSDSEETEHARSKTAQTVCQMKEYLEDDPQPSTSRRGLRESQIESAEASTSKRPRRDGHIPEQFNPGSTAWTLPEKQLFLEALKDFGTSSSKAINNKIPTKNEFEIKEFLLRETKLGRKSLRENATNESRQAPIDKWIHFLSKKVPQENYKFFYIARVLKYIALFEKREPMKKYINQVNLKDVYSILSSLLSGDGPKYTNRETSYFLNSLFQDLGRDIRMQNNAEQIKILSLQSWKKRTQCYGKQKKESGSVLDDAVVNPLQIPENILQK